MCLVCGTSTEKSMTIVAVVIVVVVGLSLDSGVSRRRYSTCSKHFNGSTFKRLWLLRINTKQNLTGNHTRFHDLDTCAPT